MQSFTDQLIASWFEVDPSTWAYSELFYAATILVFCGVVFFLFVLPFAGISTWMERKIAARMQSRIGPNRAGPHGIMIWMADGVKLLLKEDLIPAEADRLLFRLGPYLVLMGLATSFVVVPFAAGLVIADMNLALFYLLAVTAIEVVGILISGWSSNSKWSLFGGFRSAAQIISYEIPVALAFMVVALSAGTLSIQQVVMAQGGAPWDWYLFHSPMHFLAFWIYIIAALAEGNRTPFDLPEAESELVSGFNTEYSGFRFSSFFMAEFANIWVMNAIGALLFLGGWQVPGIAAERLQAPLLVAGHLQWAVLGLMALSLLSLFVKAGFGVLVVLWIRWTLPRIRIDQMMNLCWKYLVPVGMACVVLTAGWELLLHNMPSLRWFAAIPLLLGSVVAAGLFVVRTRRNISDVGDHVSMENW